MHHQQQLLVALLVEVVHRLSSVIAEFVKSVNVVICDYHASLDHSDSGFTRKKEYCRRTFDNYSKYITQHVFGQMFRMCREAFISLCSLVSKEFGNRVFHSDYGTTDDMEVQREEYEG